ncbi:MAG TPA: hypothetical protein VGQ00_00680 [Candidatus Norongarragalinales archaeon]|jgi:hypothetical protein|nr:hypothetical protein [Candidatus Norongarragalinales archaeon]
MKQIVRRAASWGKKGLSAGGRAVKGGARKGGRLVKGGAKAGWKAGSKAVWIAKQKLHVRKAGNIAKKTTKGAVRTGKKLVRPYAHSRLIR